MKLSRNSKLGIIILSCIIAFVWGMNFLKGVDIFKKNTTYHAVYDDVGGLVKSSDVSMKGYRVGRVSDIRFLEDKPDKLLVTFVVEGDVKLPLGTEARIASSDIMGTRSLILKIGDGVSFHQGNDTLRGSVEGDLKEQVSMQVLPLKNKAEQMLASLDSVLVVITKVFNPETRQNLSETFENINITVANLQNASTSLDRIISGKRENLETMIQNFSEISDSLNTQSGSMANILRNFSSLSDSLSKLELPETFQNFSMAVENIELLLKKINEGEGTVGALFNDEKLYYNLVKLSTNINILLTDLHNNPKRYVSLSMMDFGKNIHIMAPSENSQYPGVLFRVSLLSTSKPLAVNDSIFSGFHDVEEIKISGKYHYVIGNTNDFSEITELYKLSMVTFSNSAIIAQKNGRFVSLEKVLKNEKK